MPDERLITILNDSEEKFMWNDAGRKGSVGFDFYKSKVGLCSLKANPFKILSPPAGKIIQGFVPPDYLVLFENSKEISSAIFCHGDYTLVKKFSKEKAEEVIEDLILMLKHIELYNLMLENKKDPKEAYLSYLYETMSERREPKSAESSKTGV